MLEQATDSDARKLLIRAMHLCELTGRPETELLQLIEDRIARLRTPGRNIRWEEYQQFVQHNQPFGRNTEFEIRPGPAPPEFSKWLSRVVQATRLREVRALRGFTRLLPPAPGGDDRMARISLHSPNWLPAVENRGEGIFVELNLESVREWESREAVKRRATQRQKEYAQYWRDRGRAGSAPNEISARHLLVHSLAHALIRQLSLSCGYTSASLRERLYVDVGEWEMAGILIFTSSPDADGTLGGLCRQGESHNMVTVLEESLAAMAWCSSDPLCIEGVHSLSNPANGAACHACLLASETSCEEFNSFLDRAMIIGTTAEPSIGFFSDYVEQLGGSR